VLAFSVGEEVDDDRIGQGKSEKEEGLEVHSRWSGSAVLASVSVLTYVVVWRRWAMEVGKADD